jgi:hypothetical protein
MSWKNNPIYDPDDQRHKPQYNGEPQEFENQRHKAKDQSYDIQCCDDRSDAYYQAQCEFDYMHMTKLLSLHVFSRQSLALEHPGQDVESPAVLTATAEPLAW